MKSIEISTPVVGRDLIGREDWVRLFIDNFADKPELRGTEQYALVAPRRTGKTSILLETFNRLFFNKAAGQNIIPLFFNLEELLAFGHMDTFPESYLLQLYACIFNFNLGKKVYNYQNLEMSQALEIAKSQGDSGYCGILTKTLEMMEYDRSRGVFPAFRVTALPGEISRETGQAFAVMIDEAQEALKIKKEKSIDILMAYRNCWDHFSMKQSKVLHIFTGSAASLMSKEVLGGESCLFGRVNHKELPHLTPAALNELIDFHTDGPKPAWDWQARTAIFEITGGHPFYTKCLIKNLLEQKLSYIGTTEVEGAYKQELFSGIIYNTLSDDFAKYLARYKDPDILERILKQVVDKADQKGTMPVEHLHALPDWKPEAAKYLENCDIIRFNSFIRFKDRIFEDWFKHVYWALVKERKELEESSLDFPGTTANRLANDIGFLFQRLVRTVLSFFNGQAVKGDLFGKENDIVTLPVITSTDVEWGFFWPSADHQKEEYRFDVIGTGENKQLPPSQSSELWLVECKYWASRKVGIPQLEELLEKEQKFQKARGFKGCVVRWFCTKNKLGKAEQTFCKKNGIYFTSGKQVEQLIEELRRQKSS